MHLIRHEDARDAKAIHAVHTACFATPFEARLVDALRAAGTLRISRVAVDAGRVIGHVAFSPVRAGSTEGLGLAPVAVLASHRRRGIAAHLVRSGLHDCARSGCGFVVVLGAPDYYNRFGFTPAVQWGLVDTYGGGVAFQVLELLDGAVPRGAGTVRYAPEFDAVDG